MMSLQAYLAFVVACIALALLPGPIVSLLIANGLRYGTRAALINVAGAQAGLAIVIGIVAVGLTSLMATMGYWFDWVRFAGAAYLVWLGIKLIRVAGRRHQRRRKTSAAARRLLPAGISGAAVEPEGAGVLRRLHSAVHGHEPAAFPAGRPARHHLHGDRRDDGRGLRAARRPRAKILLGEAHAHGLAHLRRLHDRRRHLARADARE